MSSQAFKINGPDRRALARMLDDLPKVVRSDAIRRVARGAAKIVQKKAKANAPKDTGTLRRSIRVRSMKRSRVRVGARVVSLKLGKRYYSVMQEYGWNRGGGTTKRWKKAAKLIGNRLALRLSVANRDVRGKFFFRDAMKSTQDEASKYMVDNASKEIDKAMQKYLARRSKAAMKKATGAA